MRMACAQQARADAEPRAVIELFTSQGCSSCPAADKLLGELAHDPSLVAMSLAVDYWDYLGWKDTLALHGHTNAAARLRRARAAIAQVYTPQVGGQRRGPCARQRQGGDRAARSRQSAASTGRWRCR